MIFSHGHFMAIATKAHERDDSLVAVVFAVLSLEAFLSECVAAIQSPEIRTPEPGPTFAEILSEVDELRSSFTLRCQLARILLAGHPYDKGKAPYQDLVLLVKLRNALVHYKPDDMCLDSQTGEFKPKRPRVLEELATRGIAKTPRAGDLSSWISFIKPPVSLWAIKTAQTMMKSLTQLLPDSLLRSSFSHSLGLCAACAADIEAEDPGPDHLCPECSAKYGSSGEVMMRLLNRAREGTREE